MRIFLAVLLVTALLQPAAHAESLGRLFFSPAQRNALDAGKQLSRPKQAGKTVRGPRSLTVNGIVTRSDGESTVWVNGGPTGVRQRNSAAISATPSDPVTARVQASGTSARLRVGQTIDRASGRVREGYEARPRKPEPAAQKPSAAASTGGAEQGELPEAANAPGQSGEAAER